MKSLLVLLFVGTLSIATPQTATIDQQIYNVFNQPGQKSITTARTPSLDSAILNVFGPVSNNPGFVNANNGRPTVFVPMPPHSQENPTPNLGNQNKLRVVPSFTTPRNDQFGNAAGPPTNPLNDGLSEQFINVFGTPEKPVNSLFASTSGPESTPSNGPIGIGNNVNQPSRPGQFAIVDSGAGSNNEGCECVPYYQCQNGTISDNGIGLIDIRINQGCEETLSVCCDPPNILDGNHKVTPRPPPVARRGCGYRNANGVGFRISAPPDNEAEFAEFPWMAAIIIAHSQLNGLKVYECGGSLIHPQVILTAAHCVEGENATDLTIRLGEWDTQTQNEPLPHQDRRVSQIIIHPQFHPAALRNDYALLILSSPAEITQNVDVVCLPTQNEIFDGSRCFASGWGRDVFGKVGQFQVILKKVELPVVSNEVCQTNLRKTRLGRYFALDRSFMCAGGEPGKDTCRGDGGSPLVCPLKSDSTRYAQVGTVAWGIGCGENNVPGVYANVAMARTWIDQSLLAVNIFIP